MRSDEYPHAVVTNADEPGVDEPTRRRSVASDRRKRGNGAPQRLSPSFARGEPPMRQRRGWPLEAVVPPSTGMIWPVMY